MALCYAGELCVDPNEKGAAYFWRCTNDDWCVRADRGELIPEHRYDWWYWCSTIPQEDLDDWPELAAECDEMRRRHGDAVPRQSYVYVIKAHS